MLKKDITYTDYNDHERTETWYFNLNDAELVELQMSTNGGLDVLITRIVQEEDAPKLMELFKKIILLSVGKKSDDGKYFTKNEQIREEFASTEAYVKLFMELSTDADAAVKFINGIVPKDKQVNDPIPFPGDH